ncbi:MAG: excinuclease ABC subunit A [Pseudomonadota bacterium]
MSIETRITWLKTVGILLIGLGAIFAFTTTGPVAGVSVLFVDLAVFPVDGGQSYAATETRLLAAIVGGLTAGLGAAIWMIAKHVYALGPEVGRKVILTFVLIWFVVDSLGSVLSGAAFNAVLNTLLLATMLPPLLGRSAETEPAPA